MNTTVSVENSVNLDTKPHAIPLLWQGVFWKVFSCACFAGVNTLIRFLSGGSPINSITPLPIYTIMMFQNLIGLAILIPIILKLKSNKLLSFKTNNPYLHIIRVVTAVIGISFWYLSLLYMPVAQVIALSFAGPIITIVGSKLILHENFNWQRSLAVGLSLLGGFLIARPDKGIISSTLGLAAFLPLIAATVFAGDKLITRKIMSEHESPLVLTFYLLGFTGFACIAPHIYYGFPNMSSEHFMWLSLLGIIAMAAHFSFSKAYELAEVTFLMPFGISKFIISSTVAYMAFAEIPKTLSMWLGIAVVFLSSLILNFKLKRVNT